MSYELLARLRDLHDPEIRAVAAVEAADEIERLQAEVDDKRRYASGVLEQWTADLERSGQDYEAARSAVEALQAEVSRLRSALRGIAEHDKTDPAGGNGWDDLNDWYREVKKIARDALAGDGGC